MTAPTAAGPPHHPHTGRPVGQWGLACLVVTEGMLFALLLFAYSQTRATSPRWPLGDIAEPELVRSGLRTAVLLASSIPMHLADRAAEARDRSKLVWSLAVGWAMGALFLVGHLDEWATSLEEFTPATNAYGSFWYTITGFHALHLLVGLVVVGFLALRAMAGRYDDGPTVGVRTGILYWHFVDVVWVAVYGILYLSVALP